MAGTLSPPGHAPARVYSPPSLVILAASSAAENLHRLLPRQSEEFRRLSEEGLILLYAFLVQKGKLTPRTALAFQQVASEHGHAALAGIVGELDVAAGIAVVGDTVCGEPKGVW